MINQLELKIGHLHHDDYNYLVKSLICDLCRIKIIPNIKKLIEAQNLHQLAKSHHCEVNNFLMIEYFNRFTDSFSLLLFYFVQFKFSMKTAFCFVPIL